MLLLENVVPRLWSLENLRLYMWLDFVMVPRDALASKSRGDMPDYHCDSVVTAHHLSCALCWSRSDSRVQLFLLAKWKSKLILITHGKHFSYPLLQTPLSSFCFWECARLTPGPLQPLSPVAHDFTYMSDRLNKCMWGEGWVGLNIWISLTFIHSCIIFSTFVLFGPHSLPDTSIGVEKPNI